jgi:hypothetical protein
MAALRRLRTALAAPRYRASLVTVLVTLMLMPLVVAAAVRGGDTVGKSLHVAVAPTTTEAPKPEKRDKKDKKADKNDKKKDKKRKKPKPPPKPVAPLTGKVGEFGGRIHRPALIIKIDNVPMARPQAGLRKADIVIEEPVEGNFTRLAAIFHSKDAYVGPVRSVRTTDLEFVPLLGRSLFGSSGGNLDVLGQLAQADVVDVGHHTAVGHVYHRISGRRAPHNLFVGTPELHHYSPERPPPPRPMFSYLKRGENLPNSAKRAGGIVLWFGRHEVSRFYWHKPSGTWHRFQEGTPHLDAEGMQIAPKNVVVLEIEYDMTGQLGRSVPHGITAGTGRATVLTQGRAIVGRWERPSLMHPIRLLTNGGREIKLSPGQTFVELPPHGSAALLAPGG